MAKDRESGFEKEIEALRQTRDELRVQAHLGAAEARDAWAKLEKSWERLEGHVKQIGQITQESADDVGKAAKTLAQEIKAGYERVREML